MDEYQPPTTKAGRDAERLIADIEEKHPEYLAGLNDDPAYQAFIEAMHEETMARQARSLSGWAPGEVMEVWGK